MPTYRADITTQTLFIKATSEEEAEEKYNSYFGGGDCPCGVGGLGEVSATCDCVYESSDIFHTMELEKE